MDSFTKTTLLVALGLACVVMLVLLPFKEDENSSGIRSGIRAKVRGSRSRGEPRQVSNQMARMWLTHSSENSEELSQQF